MSVSSFTHSLRWAEAAKSRRMEHRFPLCNAPTVIRQNIVDRLKRDDDLGRYYTDSE
jgi:hypothetical protein